MNAARSLRAVAVALACFLAAGISFSASPSPASPQAVHDQMVGVARLVTYGVRCGAKEPSVAGMRRLHDAESRLFKLVDDLRKLHRDATTHQEAMIRVDKLPADLEDAASLRDVQAGWKQGVSEASAAKELSAHLCSTVLEAVPQGNAVAADAADHLSAQVDHVQGMVTELGDRLRQERQKAKR